jgi:hypothetical protein
VDKAKQCSWWLVFSVDSSVFIPFICGYNLGNLLTTTSYAATGTKILGFDIAVMVLVWMRANTIGLPSLPYLSSKSRFNWRTSGSSSVKKDQLEFLW